MVDQLDSCRRAFMTALGQLIKIGLAVPEHLAELGSEFDGRAHMIEYAQRDGVRAEYKRVRDLQECELRLLGISAERDVLDLCLYDCIAADAVPGGSEIVFSFIKTARRVLSVVEHTRADMQRLIAGKSGRHSAPVPALDCVRGGAAAHQAQPGIG